MYTIQLPEIIYFVYPYQITALVEPKSEHTINHRKSMPFGTQHQQFLSVKIFAAEVKGVQSPSADCSWFVTLFNGTKLFKRSGRRHHIKRGWSDSCKSSLPLLSSENWIEHEFSCLNLFMKNLNFAVLWSLDLEYFTHNADLMRYTCIHT